MPVLRCPGCEAVIAYSGKPLSVGLCPERCRGGRSPTLHVNEHLIAPTRLNGDGPDVHASGRARRQRARRFVEESRARG